MRSFKLNEISAVDRPAQAHAKVVIMKRDDEPYWKRVFTQAERDKAAESGAALPDGSFPIKTKADLANAIRAIGRAKDPAKAKAHIIARAKVLGATDMLPEGWSAKKGIRPWLVDLAKTLIGKDASSFDDIHGDIEAAASAADLLDAIDRATSALRASVCSIVADDECEDKPGALAETFGQFSDHVASTVPDEMDKAFVAASLAASTVAKGAIMSDELKKQLADVQAELVKIRSENAILKMSEKHKGYMDEAKMSAEQRDTFAAKSPDERDAHMTKHPVAKSIDPEVAKRDAEIAKRDQQIADQNARLAKLEEDKELAAFGKRAVELGLPEAEGATLMKAHKGEGEAVRKLEGFIKGLQEQVRTGKVFAEFGTNNGGDATTAKARMTAKVAELRKADTTIKTDAEAIAKIAKDPASRDLWGAYKAETSPVKSAA